MLVQDWRSSNPTYCDGKLGRLIDFKGSCLTPQVRKATRTSTGIERNKQTPVKKRSPKVSSTRHELRHSHDVGLRWTAPEAFFMQVNVTEQSRKQSFAAVPPA